MNWFEYVLDGSLMPHGMCLLWRADLLLLHVGGDILTSIAYFIIPLALIYLVTQRSDLQFDRIFLMFSAFIFLCGVTHTLAIVNIWSGFYFLQGVAKFSTGIVSIITAAMIWRLMPKALAVPSAAMLIEKNRALQEAEGSLKAINLQLEQRVAERTRELEALSITDFLTGVPNRGKITDQLHEEIDRAERYGHSFAVLMIDLDDFKQVNDRFGHLIGDQVLVAAANLFSRNLRSVDMIGRYGGEEFMAVLPNANDSEAEQIAERMRSDLASQEIPVTNNSRNSEKLFATCSIGVAAFQSGNSDVELIQQADKALYKAKQSGKNRVIRASSLALSR